MFFDRRRCITFFLSLSLVAIAPPSFAQHDGPAAHAQTPPGPSPYAGEQTRAIKALSPTQIDDLRAGRGMAMALAAELNGYPGPAHVLEWADALQLTPAPHQETSSLLAQMNAQARTLGEEVIQAEAALDGLFSNGHRLDEQTMVGAVERAALAQGRLRAAHLSYHLAMAKLLTAEQRSRYNVLRGYTNNVPQAATH